MVLLRIAGAVVSEEGSDIFGLLVKRGCGSEHQLAFLTRSVRSWPELRDIRPHSRAYVLDRQLIPGVKLS